MHLRPAPAIVCLTPAALTERIAVWMISANLVMGSTILPVCLVYHPGSGGIVPGEVILGANRVPIFRMLQGLREGK